MQNERLARAQTALENGDMAVLPVDPCKWIVVSKKSQYTVTLDGDAWACTCPDFAGRCQRFGLLCKHIEAIRYLETRQISEAGNIDFPNTKNALPVQHTEDFMNQTPTMALGNGRSGAAHRSTGHGCAAHRRGDLAAAPAPGHEPGQAPPGARPGNSPLS